MYKSIFLFKVLYVSDISVCLSHSFVEIVHLDFVTETSHQLLLTRAPDSMTIVFDRPSICGDIAAVVICAIGVVMVVNWKTASSITLRPTSVRQIASRDCPKYISSPCRRDPPT